MLNNKSITVIIPCKNEQAAIHSMMQKIPKYVDEVIVVDNNSRDNTAVVAREHGAKVFTEKKHVEGVGYGYAHQTGMKHATGDIIVALDGDDTYPIEAIKEVVQFMEKSNSDFVSCARFPLSDPDAISPIRQLGVGILNLEVTLLYGYPMQDILSGMWVMRKECMKKINAKCGEWNFSPEIKLAAIAHPDIHFSEYHIAHAVRLNGVSKQQIWKTGFNHLFYILNRRFTVDKFGAKKQFEIIINNFRFVLKAIPALFVWKVHS